MSADTTFCDVFQQICENNIQSMIISYSENKRYEYHINEWEPMINMICSFLCSKYVSAEIKEGDWVGMKCDDNAMSFFVLFALLKMGWNVFLLANEDNVFSKFSDDIDILELFDSTIVSEAKKHSNCVHTIQCKNNDGWADRIAFCSSGTTGKRQIIVHTATSVLSQMVAVSKEIQGNTSLNVTICQAYAGEKKILSFLPTNHILGFLLPLVLLYMQCDLVFVTNIAIYKIIAIIKEENVLASFGVPIVWRTLKNIISRRGQLHRESVDTILGMNFKVIMSGGSKTDPLIRKFYHDIGIHFFVGYGLTETGFLTLGESLPSTFNSEGKLYNGYEVRILSSDGTMKKDGIGELLVSCDNIYRYVISNKSTKPPELYDNKYFRTGDIFQLKDDYLYFKGRVKNIIVNETGENIYIEELEALFEQLAQAGIVYYVNEYEGSPALFVDGTRINETMYEDDVRSPSFINVIKEINITVPIDKKIKYLLITGSSIPCTAKGEPIRWGIPENSLMKQIKL